LPPPPNTSPVFCSIVDSAYFVGAVALVNSLRLTGHKGEIAFLDVGLEPKQRDFLGQVATMHDGPKGGGWLSVFAKPILGSLYPERVVVFIDNDVVITGSLESLVQAAEDGAIVVIEDKDLMRARWFPEWEEMFSLREPLRRSPYANGGLVALSSDRWRWFLDRWYELSQMASELRAGRPFVLRSAEVDSNPVGFNEQDVLNALLMSEVPESAVRLWPHSVAPAWEERRSTRVTDTGALRCEADGETVLFLHFTGQPKPWQRHGWLKLRFRAFNRLLTRVLEADDVPLRLPREEVPPWLRAGIRGRLLENAGAAVASVAYAVLSLVPDEYRTRVTAAVRARLSGTGARA
jgi:hypothetical protein